MIELYVLLSLGVIGYIANASGAKTAYAPTTVPLKRTDIPQVTVPMAERWTQQRAAQMYQKAQVPTRTAVIDKNFGNAPPAPKRIRSLTGEYMSEGEFTHNNMVPYFGGRSRQNTKEGVHATLMENFTGVSTADYKRKCEIPAMFDMSRDLGNVRGTANQTDYYRDRMEDPRARNNELPFTQQRVGPGLGKGFGSAPTGGYQQLEIQDYARPKCVDELRVGGNPKLTFEGRMVDGQKARMRGEVGAVNKNRVNTFFEQGEDRLLKTTGAYLKPTEVPEFNVKPTHRLDTTREYMGTAIAANKARTAEPAVRLPMRSQLGEFGLRNPALNTQGKGDKDDYGKANIQVYANERDITTTRVHQGNVTSLIKAVMAPLLDILGATKKDEVVHNARHFGNMSVQIPDKAPVHDPNDVARTTIKETTIHDAILGNLKGSEKLTIYDPNDIARTTVKETLIHDETGTGTITGPKQLMVYDPDEIAKQTLRETLERMDYEMNLAAGVKKGTVHDPDDVLKTTMKETLIEALRNGNIDRMEGTGDYNTTEYEARRTQKEFFSDQDYIGGAGRDMGGGYETNEFDAKHTQKEFLSDVEYYGNAEASTDKKQMSYDDMYNAAISSRQESLLAGREPTTSGKKVTLGKECVNMDVVRKNACATVATRATPNLTRLTTEVPTLTDQSFTRMKKDYGADNRLDTSLLKAFLENPYTQPLNSVA